MSFLKNEAKELLLFLIFVALFFLHKHTIGSLTWGSENLFLQWFYDMDAQGVKNMLNYEARNKTTYSMFNVFGMRWSGIFSTYIYYRICTYLYSKYQQWRNKKESSTLEIQTISKKDRLIFELKIVIDFIFCSILFNVFSTFIMNWMIGLIESDGPFDMVGALAAIGTIPFAAYISYRITKTIRNKTWRRILNHG